jgi:hypothetical protein
LLSDENLLSPKQELFKTYNFPIDKTNISETFGVSFYTFFGGPGVLTCSLKGVTAFNKCIKVN